MDFEEGSDSLRQGVKLNHSKHYHTDPGNRVFLHMNMLLVIVFLSFLYYCSAFVPLTVSVSTQQLSQRFRLTPTGLLPPKPHVLNEHEHGKYRVGISLALLHHGNDNDNDIEESSNTRTCTSLRDEEVNDDGSLAARVEVEVEVEVEDPEENQQTQTTGEAILSLAVPALAGLAIDPLMVRAPRENEYST